MAQMDAMQVVYTRCAGLDIHKRSIVACRIAGPADPSQGPAQRQTQTFGTTPEALLTLYDWLSAAGVTHVAMESTGTYWKPIYNLLETSFEVWLLNAQHIKAVPGRKTDVKDAEWIANLLRHGLVRPSFIPPQAQRDLRELVRERANFIRTRSTLANRVQKVLEGAGIKLGNVLSDVLGASGRTIIEAMLAGEADPDVMVAMTHKKVREGAKREELKAAVRGAGQLRGAQRFLLRELLGQFDSLSATIVRCDEAIKEALAEQEEEGGSKWEQAVELLDSVPGIGRETAELLVAEVGVDMSRFPSAAHLAAWAGLAPSNNQSGSKWGAGTTRKGNHWVRSALVQSAHGAVRTKGSSLGAQYYRIAARRGKKRALVAVAHALIVIVYHVIARREPYRELGADYLERQRPEAVAKRYMRRIEKLGFKVTLEPIGAAA
jgi:transposase